MAKVLFIQNSWFEYHGVEFLSAVLKKGGHSCELYFVGKGKEDKVLDYIKESKPNLLAFSISSIQNRWAFDFAEKAKKAFPWLYTIFGGPHPTFFPKLVIEKPYVDMLCIGEGEGALLELASAIHSGSDMTRIHNIWFKKNGQVFTNEPRPFAEDLDSLPFQDRTLYYKNKFAKEFPVKRFLAGRGCPFNCSFCFNRTMKDLYKGKGKYVRIRSVGHIIEEIKEVRDRYGLKLLAFTDDTFTLNKKWLLEFLETYRREVSLPFTCFTRADNMDEEIIKNLKRGGCHMICFAIESGDERIRNDILRKKLSNERILETARLLRKYRLKFFTFNMIGLPTETIEQAFETLTLNAKIGTTVPYFTVFQPLPGTDIYNFSKDKGLLSAEIGVEHMEQFFFFGDSIPLNQPSSPLLPNLHKLSFMAVKFPWAMPAIRLLVKLPLGSFYKLVFNIGLFYQEKLKLNLGWFEAITIARKLRKEMGSESA